MKRALILSGGGARAAYQVGVLKALAQIVPKTEPNPFQIICGTSAGAINAAKIASEADDFHQAVVGLENIWGNLTSAHVHQVDYRSVLKSIIKIFVSLFHSGIAKGKPLSLFDNRPLAFLLKRSIDMSRLNKMITEHHLHALSINALGYSTGQNIAFFQGHESIKSWSKARRLGLRTQLQLKHLMASTAIPAVFPSVRINREFFGDGAVRQSAPLSIPLKMGADKIMVIGVSGNAAGIERLQTDHSPSIAQVFGNMLNSAFIDAMDEDLYILERFNRVSACISEEQQKQLSVRPIDTLIIEPSVKFDVLAAEYEVHLPKSMRFLLSMVGANKKGSGGSLASYVLFEKAYCQALIEIGYADAMKQIDKIKQFMAKT
jgi:NTE family protein